MDSGNHQRYQDNTQHVPLAGDGDAHAIAQNGSAANGNHTAGESAPAKPAELEGLSSAEIIDLLKSGEILMVNARKRNGLIICKEFHAEFAGPGAVIGGVFDLDCKAVVPLGNLSLLYPEDHEDRQKAFLIRRQWIRLTQQFTDKSSALQRAQMILNQFENYFDSETIARLPDEAFALLVGVLPHTIRMARRPPVPMSVKVNLEA